jgi:hypothetical protein
MILGGAAVLAVTPTHLAARNGQSAGQVQPAPQAVVDLQRAYDHARARREPVTHLLANAFVEIQGDGRVLTRAQAVEKYSRVDDVSAGALTERRTASYGAVVVIAGRTGEEGMPYSSRRLYVWVKRERNLAITRVSDNVHAPARGHIVAALHRMACEISRWTTRVT